MNGKSVSQWRKTRLALAYQDSYNLNEIIQPLTTKLLTNQGNQPILTKQDLRIGLKHPQKECL